MPARIHKKTVRILKKHGHISTHKTKRAGKRVAGVSHHRCHQKQSNYIIKTIMPYSIHKSGKYYKVINTVSGCIHAQHTTLPKPTHKYV